MRDRLTAAEQAYLAEARVCRVASVGPDGRPHASPFCHAYDRRRRTVYITTEPTGRTARNLRANPAAALTCDDYRERWERLRGIVVQARAREVTDPAELARARRLLRRKYRQYREYELDYIVALDVERATSWGL
jgi:nitroimidazol reductase NimA-like FMN-containing flavoprotein (pyridoxamine 5'-phosphate oxidase superfamily)